MAVTSTFREAVASENLRGVRIMIKDSLLNDRSFNEFNEKLSLAEGKLPELFVPHDGKPLNNDSSAWTSDYMDELMVQVVFNFSRERLELLKKVVRHLRPVPATDTAASRPTAPRYEAPHREDQSREAPRQSERQYSYHSSSQNGGRRNDTHNPKNLGTGLAVAGGAAAVIGAVVSSVIVVIGGIAVAGAGIAMIASEKDKRDK